MFPPLEGTYMKTLLTRTLTLAAAASFVTALGCASNSGGEMSDDETIHPHKSGDNMPKDIDKDKPEMAVDMPEPKRDRMSDKAMSDKKMMDDKKMANDGMNKGMKGDSMAGSTGSMTAEDLMMKADGDIIETATGPGMTKVTTLVKAIKAADLVQALQGEGPFTVFAPTNAAFDKLPAGTLDELLKPENKSKLQTILKHHVHSGDAVLSKDIETMSLSTLAGGPVSVTAKGGNVMIGSAKVVKSDIVASNGIIHWVDTVILP